MNDTDRLIAAMFAATMTARTSEPDLGVFFAHFDSCLEGFRERAAEEDAKKLEQTAAAHKKAWGE